MQWSWRSIYVGIALSVFICLSIYHLDVGVHVRAGSFKYYGSGPEIKLLPFGPIATDVLHLQNRARDLLKNRSVVARVFYGRRDRVEILECYLRRNLKQNGGLLDQVDFVYQTGSGFGIVHPDDIDYLNALTEVEPAYNQVQRSGGFGHRYDDCLDDVIYFKIDDDVVYIDDAAIPSMVISLFEYPEFPFISANVVRHALLSHVHARIGAIVPIQLVHDDGTSNSEDWRMSHLPSGTYDEFAKDHRDSKLALADYSWLPIRSGTSLRNTPMARAGYSSFGECTWASPYCGLQTHLSFFIRKEEGTLSRFNFGHHWDYSLPEPERASINFIAWIGRNIYHGLAETEQLSIPEEDEQWLTVDMLKVTGLHHIAIGAALVSHLSYGQHRGFERPDWTMVLAKYKNLAKDTGHLREWTTDHWRVSKPERIPAPEFAPMIVNDFEDALKREEALKLEREKTLALKQAEVLDLESKQVQALEIERGHADKIVHETALMPSLIAESISQVETEAEFA